MAETLTIRTASSTDVVKVVEAGPQGPAGSNGQGVPTGGTTGQVLRKASATNYDTEWATGGGGSGTVTSVALTGTGLSISGSPITASGTITANVAYGTTAGTACQGNDSRLSDARTPLAHTHPSSEITDLKTNGNAAGLWDSVNDEQLVSTGDGELQIRKTGTALSGAFNAGQLTADRGYNLPDSSGTLALITDNAPSASGLFDATNDVVGLTVSDSTLSVTDGVNTSSIAFPVASRSFDLPNASGTLALTTTPPASHAHGNITNTGAIGSTENLPLITTTSGVVTTGAFGTGATDFAAGNHTHAQLHNQSHAITSTSDHTANNWKIWYSNGSGQVTELALGAANTVLTSSGTASAPTFSAPSAGGSTNLWIPASAWIPRTTTGCGVNSLEASTNKVNYDMLEFDTATQEYAQAAVVMPNNWNAGTITAKFHWTAASGSGGVTFSLAGRALGDNGQIDQAMGSSQSADDTLQTANYVHISPATSAVTLAGSPAAGQLVILELSRVVSASNDTLAVDARFLGAEISFN